MRLKNSCSDFFISQKQLTPPTAVAYNHDPYPLAFEAAELQIIDIYYTLKSYSTVKAEGFRKGFRWQTQLMLH